VIRDYQDEITELFTHKLPSETICNLIEQCDSSKPAEPKTESDQSESVDPSDLLNLESQKDARFECGLHPRHWCTNLETAKRCNAFNTCLANWAKSNAKYVVKPIEGNQNSAATRDAMDQKTCGFCIFVFTKLQSVIQQNSTEASIRSYLESACAILPSKTETDNCLNTVERYWPEIYNVVRSNIDPGIICRVIDACHDKHLQPAPAQQQQQQQQQTSEKQADQSNKEWIAIQLSKMNVKIVNEDKVVIKTPLQPKFDDEEKKTEKPLTSILTATNGVGCDLCIITMSTVKYLVMNKVDNDKILSFIETQMCSRLGELNATCVDYFQKEGPEMFELLEKELLSPQHACFRCGVCTRNQFEAQSQTLFFDLQARNPSNCTMCKMIVFEVKEMIANKKTESQIIDYISKNLCERVGNNRELCKSILNTYSDWFFQLVQHDLKPDQICTLLGLCPKKPSENKEIKADPQCVLCEFVISLLTQRINPNATKDEIQKELNLVCKVAIPKNLRAQCTAFVEKYGPLVADIVLEEVTPDNVCQLIGLCTVQAEKQQQKQQKSELEKSIDNSDDKTLTCAMCEFLANMLSKIIDKNMDEALIIQDLEHICNTTMPQSLRSKCDYFVDNYGSKLVEYLITDVSPDVICGLISACPHSSEQKPMFDLTKGKKTQKIEFEEPIRAQSNTTCVMCEFVVTLLSKLVDDNTTEPEMVKELEFLCNYTMPNSWRDECTQFVDLYGPKIIDYLVHDVDPEAVCALIELCPEKQPAKHYHNRLIGAEESKFFKSLSKQSSHQIAPVDKTNEMQCVVCQFIVKFLSNQMQIDRTKEVLEIAVKHVCELSPSSYKQQCDSIIKDYGDKLIELIDKMSNSLEVCKILERCESTPSSGLVDIQTAEPRKLPKEKYNELLASDLKSSSGETLECQLCVYVAQLANHFLKQNKTEDEIVGELKLVCNYFPNDLKDQCSSFINEYGPYVIQMIADDIDPSSTCQTLNFCEAGKKKFASYLIHYKIRP